MIKKFFMSNTKYGSLVTYYDETVLAARTKKFSAMTEADMQHLMTVCGKYIGKHKRNVVGKSFIFRIPCFST